MKHNDFKTKTIREIKLWAWAATVLPLTGLAGIFFLWFVGTDSLLNLTITIGGTVMFAVAVVWWWWAIRTMRNLVTQWDTTKVKVIEVLDEVVEIRTIVKDTFIKPDDK
jgi:protein-S-isoprenylcysteine O-methyltransferase Ste14